MRMKPTGLSSPRMLGILGLLVAGAATVYVVRPVTPSPALQHQAVASASIQASFRPAETPVRGSFTIRQEGSRSILELSSDFKTNDRAPDLKIAFSPSSTPLAKSQPPAYPLAQGTYTVLAPLKSSSGAQTYVVPAAFELSRQKSILIWCEAFNATMAWAPLQ